MLESQQQSWDFHKKIGDVTSVSPHPSERILSSTRWAKPNSWSIIISYRSHATVAMKNNIFRIIFYDFHILSSKIFTVLDDLVHVFRFYLLAPLDQETFISFPCLWQASLASQEPTDKPAISRNSKMLNLKNIFQLHFDGSIDFSNFHFFSWNQIRLNSAPSFKEPFAQALPSPLRVHGKLSQMS